MQIKLKPIQDQIIVITGASSGIGLATAEAAAAAGARLVLAARSDSLPEIALRLKAHAIAVACDVAYRAQMEEVANAAIKHFGKIDTWINNAGISIYGKLDQVSEEDSRRLFETNFWGVYNGSLVALKHLRRRGGAIINLGSEVSEAVVPLQGIYSASKHAVKGFTDALRVEVEFVDKLPISVTLIQPSAVDTPYPQHAKNYMNSEPKLPSPLIEVEKVAEAIISAAMHPTRSMRVGTMAKLNYTLPKLSPSIGDKIASTPVNKQNHKEAPRHPDGALYNSSESTGVVGQTHGTGGAMVSSI